MRGARSRSKCLTRVSLAALAVALSVAALAGCDRPPSPTGEWSPKDHDRVDENSRVQSGAQAPSKSKTPTSPAEEARQLTEMTWQRQCAACHGAVGHGDGPNGPMVKATNLTADEWQAKVSDADIATSIRKGKGQMPKFDLPDSVVGGLVGRIRAMRGR